MVIKDWIRKTAQKLGDKERGAALVVTLLVVLVLVLLGLALSIQSQTEYVISINEQDAITALGYGEAIIDWMNNIVIDYAQLPITAPPDLSDLLEGPDDTGSTADDNLLDLGWPTELGAPGVTRTLNTGITQLTQLNETNEQTESGIINMDWDGPGSGAAVPFQFFRMGMNTTGGSDWDGPRAEIYFRIEDNYDTGSTLDVVDNDFRMRGLMIIDYPVFVEDDGTRIPEGKSARGTARRKLVARFAPAGNVAIRTDGDLNVNGALEVCGECGSVHANEGINVAGSSKICGQATATEDITINHSDPTQVRGGAGLQGEIFIPRINPYDDRWSPPPTLFITTDDNTLPTYVQCPGPDVGNWDHTIDPGATKYFAIVLKRDAADIWELYKAYRDNTNSRWVWRLIDDNLSTGTNPTPTMDNCGRITSTSPLLMITPDPMPSAGNAYWGVGDRPAWAGVGVTNPSGFYGFEIPSGNAGDYDPASCTDADETLSTVFMNDFSPKAYMRMDPLVDPFNNPPGSPDTDIDPTLDYTNFTLNTAADPLLPGTYGDWTTADANPNPVRDGQRDFRSEDALTTGNTNLGKNEIRKNDDIYSPIWGGVFFIYGNFGMNGTGTFNYRDAFGASVTGASLTGTVGYWASSFIVFNAIKMTGNPIFGPPGADFPVTFVAGRDISMAGTGNNHLPGNQATCPDQMGNLATDCTENPPNPDGREGMVLTHEEVHFSGNVAFDGFIVAEDAATCVPLQTDETLGTGSVQVRYDCNNPPNLWGDRSVRIVGWEEVQLQ